LNPSSRAGDAAVEKQAKAALRRSEPRFRDLAESLPHMVWTCAADGPCDYLSPQWLAYTGVPEEEQLGYGWLAQLHPDDVELTKMRWAAATVTVTPFDTEFRIRRHDGIYRWFKTRAVPVLDPDGGITKWFGTNTDIQDLRDAQEAAAELNRKLEERVLARTEELCTANAKLESLANQLQLAQRIAQVGSGELEVATGRVTWSEELHRIMGRDPSAAVPNFEDHAPMFTRESWGRVTRGFHRCLATGEGAEGRLVLVWPDGTLRTVVARAELVCDAEGRGHRIVATCQDVTDRERVNARLQELTERLQLATTAARIGVWDWNLRDNILVWDDTMYQIYGTSPECVTSPLELWPAVVHSEDRAKLENLLTEARSEARDFDITLRIVRPNGEVRHLNSVALVHRDPWTGHASRMVGVDLDITERRAAELALRTSEALQRGILAHAGSAIIATDPDGTVTLFNHAAETLLGYLANEVVGVATVDFIHDSVEVDAHRVVLERELGVEITTPLEVLVIKSRSGKADVNEWTYIRKDGSRVPVWLTVSTLRDETNEIFGYLGIAVDLTSRKLQEAELLKLNRLLAGRSEQAESANHAKSMFLANMSHEIRTPMGAITGVAYLLSKTRLSPEQKQLVSTIERSTKTLLGVVNDILDLSKIEAQQLTLDVAPFRLCHLLDELVGLMTGYATGKDLQLVLDAHEALPERLVGDRVRLMQVLTNLTGNAIKFTERGAVHVSVRSDVLNDDKVRLRFDVVDNGPGMDNELQSKLFTPFTQADHGPARRVGGTGLGLAIVKQLVALMGGDVGVESVLGSGSRFWFTIPLARPTQNERDESSRLKVLIIDDEIDQRLAVVATAKRLGWQVDTAVSRQDGLATILTHAHEGSPFDAVIFDSRMAGMDGVQTLVATREALGGRAVTSIIMLTAGDVDLLRDHPKATLADAILAKPFTASSMFDAVAKAVTSRTGRNDRLGSTVPHSEVGQRLPAVRLLVVDDSEVNRSIAARILELEGAEVELATHGGEAIARFLNDERGFDAILMDIQMPEVDGIEASRRIRQHATKGELPIIALTAAALASERQKALDAGMNDFVGKPFVVDTLIASVRRHVERARGAPLGIVSRPQTQERPRDWPVVAGIDTDDAYTRLDGDAPLFLNLLARLLSELDDFRRRIGSSVDAVVLPDLSARVHKLRGMAGNLGARDLHRIAGEADVALRDSQTRQDPGLVQNLVIEMDRLGASIREVLHTSLSDPPAPDEPIEDLLRPEALTSFVRALEEQNFDALAMFADLSPSLERSLGASQHRRLRAAVTDLDFTDAVPLVAGLARRSTE